MGKFTSFFPPTAYGAAIPDSQLLFDFNLALARFKHSAGYLQLADKYALILPPDEINSR